MWAEGLPHTLATVLDEGFDGIEDNTLPIFGVSNDLQCMIARRSLINEDRFLHFVCYEEGAPVAIINTQIQAAEVEADEQDPQGENEFIQAQLFCLISGDHVIWTSHNETLRESRIQDILASFITSQGGTADAAQFGFQVVLDQVVIQQALEDGISELDLNIGAFAPTLERLANRGELPERGILSKIGSIFNRPATDEEMEAARDIEGKLILRTGYDWNKPEVRELMTTLSNNVRQDYEDEFAIVTKSGLRLTRDKVSLKHDCEVQGNRRILNSFQMETQMRQVLQTFKDLGIVDE
jgi:hypothetical protein